MHWVSSERGIRRFVASVGPELLASIRVVEKLGFIEVHECGTTMTARRSSTRAGFPEAVEAAGILTHRSDRRDQSGGVWRGVLAAASRCYSASITGGLLKPNRRSYASVSQMGENHSGSNTSPPPRLPW